MTKENEFKNFLFELVIYWLDNERSGDPHNLISVNARYLSAQLKKPNWACLLSLVRELAHHGQPIHYTLIVLFYPFKKAEFPEGYLGKLLLGKCIVVIT